jgi:hypothetical protein
MKRMIQAYRPEPDFAGRIMGKYGIARWRSRLHTLILRLNPVLFQKPPAQEKHREAGAGAGPAVHFLYPVYTTRLLTQQSAPVYITNRIVRINRISPSAITHRSSMVYMSQERRRDGDKPASKAAGPSASAPGWFAQGERSGSGPPAAGHSTPVVRNAEKHEPGRFSDLPEPDSSGRGQTGQAARPPVYPGGMAALRELHMLQPLHLIHHQMRLLQTFGHGEETQAAGSLNQSRSPVLSAFAPDGGTSRAKTPGEPVLTETDKRQASGSGTRNSAGIHPQPGVPGYPAAALAAAPSVSLTLVVGKGLNRMLAGAERFWGGGQLVAASVHRPDRGKIPWVNVAGEQSEPGAAQPAGPLQTAGLPYPPAKRRGRTQSGYAGRPPAVSPILQETGDGGSMFKPAPQMLYPARKTPGGHRTAAPSMLLRQERNRSAVPVPQEPLPALPMDSGLVHRRPEAAAQRESPPTPGGSYAPHQTAVYPAAVPAFSQAPKQKTVMEADEIRLVAEQVFQVLEKRLSIQKDRRGLR